MADKKYIIVTGQSGVKVRDCISNLSKKYVSIEETISKENNIPFLDFLASPQFLQCEYWSKAFNKIFDDKLLSDTEVLTFHSIYYHQRKRELFSPINFSQLAEKLRNKVKMIIVLIDDIYDVYRRLMGPNQMFEDVSKKDKTEPLDAIYSSIFNLVSLLNWREMEISISRSIGNLLNTQMFIVATKHPRSLINRFIDEPLEDLKFFYWSHPITAIRNLAENYLASFVGKLESFLEKLLENPKLVVFFPTSIDELIIKEELADDGENFFVPYLKQRWGIPFQQDVIAPPLPSKLRNINPLNPLNYQVVSDKGNPTTYAISRLLSFLWDYIYKKQIISRDYSLVEQCINGIIACRPYFEGSQAKGVLGELNYNFLLMEKQKAREAYIFSCKNDWDKFLINKLFTILRTYLSKVPGNFELKKEQWQQENYQIGSKSIEEIRQKLEKEVLGEDYDFDIPWKKGDWPGDSLAGKTDRKKIGFKKIYEDVCIDDIDLETRDVDFKERIKYIIYENDVELFDKAPGYIVKKLMVEG